MAGFHTKNRSKLGQFLFRFEKGPTGKKKGKVRAHRDGSTTFQMQWVAKPDRFSEAQEIELFFQRSKTEKNVLRVMSGNMTVTHWWRGVICIDSVKDPDAWASAVQKYKYSFRIMATDAFDRLFPPTHTLWDPVWRLAPEKPAVEGNSPTAGPVQNTQDQKTGLMQLPVELLWDIIDQVVLNTITMGSDGLVYCQPLQLQNVNRFFRDNTRDRAFAIMMKKFIPQCMVPCVWKAVFNEGGSDRDFIQRERHKVHELHGWLMYRAWGRMRCFCGRLRVRLEGLSLVQRPAPARKPEAGSEDKMGWQQTITIGLVWLSILGWLLLVVVFVLVRWTRHFYRELIEANDRVIEAFVTILTSITALTLTALS